jgi:5-hydroxyisourate hydrolase-like protein (transthyretin family)
MRMLLSTPALLAWFSATALGANSISGTVFNQSQGQPAAGDEVALVRLDRWPQEEARAKTDAKGEFTVTAQSLEGRYVVRVFHQGVSYDQQASLGDALSIQVYDASFRVGSVTGSIEILRAGTEGNRLHVSDMYEIRNQSNPALTKIGPRTFEVYLPRNAKMDSVLAAGPGNIGMMISAAPVPGDPGHWTVNFPLRPGASKFAFNYDLPYDGHAAFHPRHTYPLEQLAVMIPQTMRFSSGSTSFERLAVGGSRYQVRAVNHLEAGEGPEFEVSGAGELPPLGNEAKSEARLHRSLSPNSTPPAPMSIPERSLVRIGAPLKRTHPPSESLALAVVTCCLLVICVVLLWRARKSVSSAPHSSNCSRVNWER